MADAGPRRRRRRPRARARARAAAQPRRSPRCCAPRATPASRATGSSASTWRPRTWTGSSRAARDRAVDLVVVGPEAPLVDGVVDALARGRASRRSARPREAARHRGLEALRQGADARRRRARPPGTPCCASRDEALGAAGAAPPTRSCSRPTSLAAGKGVIICPGRGRRRARRSTPFFTERRFGRHGGRARGVPRGRGAVAARALRRRARACRWRRRRTTSASATATRARTRAAWAATRRCRASTPSTPRRWRCAVHQPIVDELRRRGTPYHGVLYAGPDDDRRRPEGARVQLPLRRPRDPGRAAAAALGPARRCSRARRAPAGSRASSSSGRPTGP